MNWRPALAGVLAVGAVTVLGVATLDNTSSVATPAASSAPSASATPSATPAPSVMPVAPAATPAMPASMTPAMAAQGPLPVSITVPSIGVAAQLGKPLGLNPDGTVEVPPVSTPEVPGWYSLGARPGDPGNAVIIGHVDGDGTYGVFHLLPQLAKGSLIKIGRADGSVATFDVTAVETVRKIDFPSGAVYGPTTETWLQLVTCGGAYDAVSHNYIDSVIAFAKLVP